jgi:hypothetical protein
MTNNGWFKIHRQISEKWFWNKRPYDHAHAFVDMLLMAQFSESKFFLDRSVNGDYIDVPRGAFVVTIRQLSDRWGWSKSKVERFLRRLQGDSTVILKPVQWARRNPTMITFCNYSTYQDNRDNDRDKDRDKDGTMTGQRRDTKEEYKESKESKENKILSETEVSEPYYLTKKKRKLRGSKLQGFEQFWILFNYKSGKAEAADSWLDIPNYQDSLPKILLAAKAEADKRPDMIANGRTPKMAQGWLSSRRWEDEDGVQEEFNLRKYYEG